MHKLIRLVRLLRFTHIMSSVQFAMSPTFISDICVWGWSHTVNNWDSLPKCFLQQRLIRLPAGTRTVDSRGTREKLLNVPVTLRIRPINKLLKPQPVCVFGSMESKPEPEPSSLDQMFLQSSFVDVFTVLLGSRSCEDAVVFLKVDVSRSRLWRFQMMKLFRQWSS